ncbi:uncharacterized protein [Arachis hypogaea]|uniref:uncharacterized protein n=1 Tax=Arachis hypogaea TaxID=3818 RepID=UPI0010FC4830|nr:uncharacterized protein LOC114924892 [Arachis hypogaea]
MQKTPPGSLSPSTWIAPPPGQYKINVDAAVINGKTGGVGVVIRDWEGVVMAAATLETHYLLSVMKAEAMAIFMGLNIAAHGCFFDLEIEGDNIGIVEVLVSTHNLTGPFGTIIANCKALLNRFRLYKFLHVKRKGNLVAHSLANLALTRPNLIWLEETLLEICNQVHLDILDLVV